MDLRNGSVVVVGAIVLQASGVYATAHLDGRRPLRGDRLDAGLGIRPVIDHSYSLADAATAHRRSERRRTRGKIVHMVDAKPALEQAHSASDPANSLMG